MSEVQFPMLPESGVDLTDPDLLRHGVPHELFAVLRRTAPVWWNEQVNGYGDDGYWVISRHEDIAAVFRDSRQWSSNRNGVIMQVPDAANSPEMMQLYRGVIINQDPPEHTRMRKLVSRLFTPRAIGALEQSLTAAARRIVAEAAAKESGNLVDDVSARLPSMAIAELIGVAEEDRDRFSDWMIAFANSDDPDATSGRDVLASQAEMFAYTYQLAEQRRKHPTGDIVSRLIAPDDDGDVLGETEFAMFVLLLAVAGSETTRHAITHGMNAFFDFPDQWELFKHEQPPSAVEEILRWSTPVHCLQRTATADTRIAGVEIGEGQRVGLFLSSANYDESVFGGPGRFDIRRSPNPHLTFGGHGVHYCLGANLARLEIRAVFAEIARQAPDIRRLGEPKRIRSGWINGTRELMVSYRA